MTPTSDDSSPQRRGAWRLLEPLGRGGMGEVWTAVHARTGRAAACKQLRTLEPDAERLFDQEIRAIARLDHPHVVRIHDQGRTDAGEPWFVMERAAGTLGTPRDWTAVRQALDEVLAGLGAAHGAGLLHLDVKPSNVLVRADGTCAVADFGIALNPSVGTRTARYGSLPYMAPERFDLRPERLTAASDLYAVGCMAFELVHGHAPFAAADWDTAALAHGMDPVPALVPRIPVPAAFEGWVRSLLAKAPGDRFATAADARASLAAIGALAPRVGRGGGQGAHVPAATLTATVAGVARPVDALLPQGPVRAPAPVPPGWPGAVTRRRDAVGLGLLGLLAVPFVGREPELDVLWDALGRADRGAFAHVALRGAPGVGRTRLGDHLVAVSIAAAGANALVVRGRATRPLAEAVGTWLHLSDLADSDRVRDALALRLAVPAVAVRELADALSAGPSVEAVAGLVAQLGARRRTVLWVDDLHDHAETAALVRAVVDGAPAGVLLIDASTWDPTGDGVALELAPLSEGDTRRLLADWVGLGAALVADLAERCEGDVQLALSMVEDGVRSGRLVPHDDGLRLQDGARLDWPPGDVARWGSRGDRLVAELPDDVRRAVVRAAVLGADVDQAVWVGMVGEEAASRAAAVLRGDGWLAPHGGGWRWTSPLARHVLVRGAPDAVAHHRACAEAVQGDSEAARWRRGQHLLGAGELDRGLASLFDGASGAIASGNMARATRLLADVERIMVDAGVPTSSAHWGALWQTHAILGPTHQGYDACRRWNAKVRDGAQAHPDDPAWRGVENWAHTNLMWLLGVQLLPNEAEPIVQIVRGWVRSGRAKPSSFCENLGWIELTRGRSAWAIRAFETGIEHSRQNGNRHMLHASDASLGVAKRHAGHPDALAHLQRAGAALIDAGYLSARADVAVAQADAHRHLGDLDAAFALYEEALRAEAEGEARSDPGFRMGYALCLRAAGRTSDAEQELRRCRGSLTDHGPSWEGGLALHHASVGGGADVARAVADLRRTGWVDPDLPVSARLVAERTSDAPTGDLLVAFAEEQERALAHGREGPAEPPF